MSGTSVTKQHSRIFLWSTRRVLSTALQRAVFQLNNTEKFKNVKVKHFYEPFAVNFHIGINEHRSKQFDEKDFPKLREQFAPVLSINQILNSFTADMDSNNNNNISNNNSDNNIRYVQFIKEHAIQAFPNAIPDSLLLDSTNTFIIRNPEKAVKSLWRQILQPERSLFDRLVSDQIGFKEQFLLYDHIINNLKLNTFIIDADDLIDNPKTVLQNYCQFVNLPYDDCMLDWSNDDKIDNGVKPWDYMPPGWFDDINETKGFRKKDKKQDANIEYPQIIHDTIEECMPFYEKMFENRFIP